MSSFTSQPLSHIQIVLISNFVSEFNQILCLSDFQKRPKPKAGAAEAMYAQDLQSLPAKTQSNSTEANSLSLKYSASATVAVK